MDRQHAGAVYQNPLAYLLGLQGIALLRAFSGAYDREFTLARCGTGRHAAYLASLGHTVVGVDSSHDMLAAVPTRSPRRTPRGRGTRRRSSGTSSATPPGDHQFYVP